MAVELAPPGSAPERAAELWRRQRDLSPTIAGLTNGPYLVTNVATISNWLGEPMPVLPQMALCRCGASAIKPRCDGSHARIGFTSDKEASRVPDRRDTYAGLQATVYDNRGLCQHSGFCTDRLPSVFHVDGEPFVTPSGGPLDEIIRAARDCPSGALSYGLDGRESRQEVDRHHTRKAAIEVSRDGPYRVTGGIPLVTGSQADESRNEGASREHYALCRCGHSQNKPFCSGMHWRVGFRDPPPDSTREPTIFEWCGGLPALLRMTRVFYESYVPRDPLLAPLFCSMSPDHPERVAKWLAEVFGGPRSYSQEYGGYPRMLSQHVGKTLSEEQRQRWVSLLLRSAQDAGLPNDAEFRSAFGAYIEWGSRLAVENSQPGARPSEHMPMPRWHWDTAAGPPGSRVSALAGERADESTPVPPGPDEPVSFERHIRSLFRTRDRHSMSFAFDLSDYDDVCKHGDAIYDRLKAGSMPCDGAWDEERVGVFKRWIDTGKLP